MIKTYTTPQIAINDANLFIELFEIDLFISFFELDLEFHTTQLIINELDASQQAVLQTYVTKGKVNIKELSREEIEGLHTLPLQTKKLSLADLSIYFYAQQIQGCMILTGDNKLRKEAEKLGIVVHGILWVFETLVTNKIIDNTLAINKLEELMKVNSWLPERECDRLKEKLKKNE
jgi:rRNA-processing protein FCF1